MEDALSLLHPHFSVQLDFFCNCHRTRKFWVILVFFTVLSVCPQARPFPTVHMNCSGFMFREYLERLLRRKTTVTG
jgi:hypothetical protein